MKPVIILYTHVWDVMDEQDTLFAMFNMAEMIKDNLSHPTRCGLFYMIIK